jgi:uncharacterized protein (DUF433 family)
MATDRIVLELAAERSVGGTGRALSAILGIMRERGFKDDDIYTALEILKKKGHIEYKYVEPGRKPLDCMSTVVAITTDGKDELRRLQSTLQFNLRLPERLQQELAEFVGKAGDSTSAVAITALKEWVRMQKFPGIDFRWSPGGRQPFVTGTGLTVWEVYHIWLDHDEDVEKIEKNYQNLKRARISVTVAYAKAFINEMPQGTFGKRPPFAREVKV